MTEEKLSQINVVSLVVWGISVMHKGFADTKLAEVTHNIRRRDSVPGRYV